VYAELSETTWRKAFSPELSVLETSNGAIQVQEAGNSMGPGSLLELRASVRFPVRMKVQIQTAIGKEDAETINVSASGVLFAFSRVLDAGSSIEVDMIMPSSTLGTAQDVRVHCLGRVIRSYRKSPTQVEVATVIDNYEMLS
jgi:hypothetical protein